MEVLAKYIGWFFSVVLAGIGINLAASYLKPFLDKVWAKRSLQHKTWTETKRRERLARIEEIAKDPHEQILLCFAINENYLSVIYNWIFAVALFALGIISFQLLVLYELTFTAGICMIILSLISGIGIMSASKENSQRFDKADILREARKSQIKQSAATLDSTQGATPEKPESKS